MRRIRIRGYQKRNGTTVRAHTRRLRRKYQDRSFGRQIHSSRPVDVRIQDESTREPYASLPTWLENPTKYDLNKVDTPLPPEYELRSTDKKDRINITIHSEKGKKIAGLDLIKLQVPEEADFKLFGLYNVSVKDDYANRGLVNYLFREAINVADSEKAHIRLKVQPDGRKSSQKWKKRRIEVAEMYAQFGFRPLDYPYREKNHLEMIRYYDY